MKIDETLLHKLEKLSALSIAKEKQGQLISELSEILTFVEHLNELDLSAFEKSVAMIEGGEPLRKDEPQASSVIKEVFAHAPAVQDGFFIVPKIIE